MSDGSSPRDVTAGAGPRTAHQDPLAADRRTLVVAAAAMVLLIGVGVVSAALFTGSACGDIGPTPLVPAAGAAVPEVVAAAFADLDDAGRDAVVDDVSALAERLGAVVGVADVGDADRLTTLTWGAAALGETTTVLDDEGAPSSAATFAAPAAVVGGGDALYSLALRNELTGQVDAVQPLDTDLEPRGACLDAATVNVPFAFHLDAGGGVLLVLRVDEDGGEPELELRGPDGARWQAPIDVTVAPPGVLGERLSGGLGDDLVVVARRVLPDETAPAVTAVARAGGDQRWSVDVDDLPGQDGPHWVEVLAVGDGAVVVGMAEEDTRAVRRLIGLDADDGSTLWSDSAAERIVQVVPDDAGWIELVGVGRDLDVRRLDPLTGERTGLATVADVDAGRAVVGQDRVLVALGDRGVVEVTAQDVHHGDLQVLAVDDAVVDDDGSVTLLLTHGEAGIAVTFGSS